jgi:RNA polymerase sigma-70 factor (ECF subfamily)
VKNEVYMQVYQQAADYRSTRSLPSTWILMLTRSRAIDRLRRECAKQQREVPIETQTLPSPCANPETHSTTTELQNVIKTALTTLSPEQRQVIEIAYYKGLSHREIAAKLNQPLGTIKTRLRLGMKALRQQLSPILADASSGRAKPRRQCRKKAAA